MKSNVFLDTDVLLDLIGERLLHYEPIAKVATLADWGKISIFTSAISFAKVSYILNKYENSESVRRKLKKFKVLVEISRLNKTVVEKSLTSSMLDLEDALQYHSALMSNCDILLTRRTNGFKDVQIPVMTPLEFITSIKKKHNI